MSEHHHHDQDHECGCGCGHDHDHDQEPIVTLTLDDGTVIECAVLTIFPVEDKEYIALLPLDEESKEAGEEVFLYRFVEFPDKDPELENIADDEEYEKVADAFDELLDQAEFEEMDEEK